MYVRERERKRENIEIPRLESRCMVSPMGFLDLLAFINVSTLEKEPDATPVV